MSEIRFGTSVGVSKEDLALYNHEDYLKYKLDHAAMDLGVLILNEKGWELDEGENIHHYRRNLYVFTAEELRDYVKSKGGYIG